MAIDFSSEIPEAEERIRPYVRETPLEPSLWLSREGRCDAWLKLENLQITGSFKLRGAANKLLSLSDPERQCPVVTASTGNHGAAVAYLLRELGRRGSIFLPRTASGVKVDRLREYGAELHFCGDDCVATEIHARRTAAETGRVFVSPYNDPHVIAGQGTVGREIERQLGPVDAVLVPVGGGGLIAGLGGYLKAVHPGVEIIACQPRNSAVMYESIRTGKIVEMESQPTLADGTAGGIEPGAVTFPICRQVVDDFVLVAEDEIRAALRGVIEKHHLLVEGAAALAVAAFLKRRQRFAGRRVVLVLSGAKISLDTLRAVL